MVSLPEPDTLAGRAGLAALLAEPGRALLAFDFDGTLAPIVADPEQARAHPAVLPALSRISGRIGTLAVITGRSAPTVVRLGGFDTAPGLDGLTVLGAYGAERWDAATGQLDIPEPPPGIAAVRAELPRVVAESVAVGEAVIEDKGGALAVHTRRAADPDGAFAALRTPLGALASAHQLTLEPGRYVLELRPPGADKGGALTALAAQANPSVVVYAGDDLGDLPAFAAVARLRETGLPGLRIHSGSTEVPRLAEEADLTVDGPAGVAALLTALADAVS